MQLAILHTSDYALTILKHTSDLTVHSVYRKAVNLKADEQLLTLQPRGSVLSPISLITDYSISELASFPFTTGKKLSLSFDIAHLSCQDLFLPFSDLATPGRLQSLAKKIRQAIALAEDTTLPPHLRGIELVFNQPDLVCESLYMNAIQNTLKQCYLALKDPVQTSALLYHLIGLGIGLTPSGDDFLCGFLAGLRLCDSSAYASTLSELLSHTICAHSERTNEISAAFLRCAVCGQFSSPVHLLTDPDVTAEKIYHAFSSVGHSSGIDTLCGIYAAFYTIHTISLQNTNP